MELRLDTILQEDLGAKPYRFIEGDAQTGLLILCDHAENALPEAYGTLGLKAQDLHRHIAYDVGAAGVAERLARELGAPAVLSCFSRLLIDPNRGLDDPTLIMQISDGLILPGNIGLDAAEIEARIDRFYQPYHRAIECAIEAAIASGNFRAPLLHRLGGYQIRLPALRDRRDDIGRLFVHFLSEELEGLGELHRLEDRDPDARPWIPAAFLARLAAAPWPGNVRQLRNIARHLAVDSRGFDEVRISPQLERLLDSSEWRLPEPPPRAEDS